MTLTEDLRKQHEELWEAMVAHPFVQELGEGTLPKEKFLRYFLQDYLFVKALAVPLAVGIAKAPDFAAARPLNGLLSTLLTSEEDLFRLAFQSLGVSPEEYRRAAPTPTTRAFDTLLRSVAYDGSFEEILTLLLVTEGAYVDWSQRLVVAGRRPANPLYREWIDIHAGEELAAFVQWIRERLNRAEVGRAQLRRMEEIFATALRYEYRFWEAAYHGEEGEG